MGKVFHYRLRVRAYECDPLGHVNNAVYIRHLQQATLGPSAGVSRYQRSPARLRKGRMGPVTLGRSATSTTVVGRGV